MSYEKRYIKGEDKYKNHKWEDYDSKCKEDDKCKKEDDECKWEDHHCHDDHEKVTDFEFDVDRPNIFNTNQATALPAGMEIPVATISFDKIKEESEVLLQGLLTILAAGSGVGNSTSVVVRIRKQYGPAMGVTGQVIYQTPPISIPGAPANTNTTSTIPVLHVDDNFKGKECNVSYVLTVTTAVATGNPPTLALVSPRTFTGTEFK